MVVLVGMAVVISDVVVAVINGGATFTTVSGRW
jgi:hypothetical protein